MEEEIELIPVEGKSGFYRDPESTAVINCDKKAYDDYMKRNLLSYEVKAEAVAKAFFHLAISKKTTGAVLTVDGGNIAASLR